MIEFNLPEGLQALFGRDVEGFNLKETSRGKTGTPFWSMDLEGRWYYMPVRLGNVELWNPIMRISSKKTIIETHLTERPGSVKEIINRQGYIIHVKGVIKRSDGLWPEEELRMLNELYQKDESLEIDSPMTCILLAGQEEMVVIKDFKLPAPKGETAIMYELELISDIDFDLEFNV